MMKVFTSEAVADPSKVEQNVREAIADRLKKHLERNEARKLTKE
jgi:U4/U6 small nuclear ribonucleoprotein PRP3